MILELTLWIRRFIFWMIACCSAEADDGVVARGNQVLGAKLPFVSAKGHYLSDYMGAAHPIRVGPLNRL